jgi:multidrug efflux pump
MFVNFFIERPIFASVIAMVIVLTGVICIPLLPVAQFPQIAPPTVQTTATYVGASSSVVEGTTTQLIEQQINGTEGMMYMTSTSNNDGSLTINSTFEIGYDLDIAAVDVQNRVAIAQPQVPEDVRRLGITTQKMSTDFFMAINLVSAEPGMDSLFLSNYAAINIVDVLKRLRGMGNVMIFGERKYSMRFWLDPQKLTSMGLTATDVINAVQDQNIQVAAGAIGQPPAPQGQAFQYTITTKGRLQSVDEFENIIVHTGDDGAIVRVKDVARVELGAENYNWFTNLNSGEAITIGLYQLPDANAVDVAKRTRATMEELARAFPKGLEYKIVYDTTVFVTESIKEVLITLGEAMILVFLVIFVFLQSFRSTLIPAVTIPVSLIGTFGLMMALGFSINTLTLFGLVLAIGLVVDDAIIVVENVSRLIEEKGLAAKEATIQAMAEVTSPIIATTLVLFAVFVPVAFMPGISGQLYKQFALTIACSVGISALNALTLSPALCAIVLRAKMESHHWFFVGFNKGFGWFQHHYERAVALFLKRWKWIIAGFAALLATTALFFSLVPTGFVPAEDMGYFFMIMQGPEGSSVERTLEINRKVEHIALSTPGIADVLTIGGFNMITNTVDSSASTFIIPLDPWDERTTPELSLDGIMQRMRAQVRAIPEAVILAFNPPPIRGLSTTGGFQFMLQDRAGKDIDALAGVARQIIQAGAERPELMPLTTTFKVNYPQLYVDLDRDKAQSLGIPISTIFNLLQAYLGSLYVNDFNKFGRVYRVYIQAGNEYRNDLTDISNLYVRSSSGDLIPLSTLVRIDEIRGPQTISHYNMFRSVEIDGANAPGYSSGQAIKAMDEIAAKVLPEGYNYEWTGTALQEIKSGKLAPFIFALALIFVFLFLAAQYESFSMPLMVMLAVPLAILGALVAQWMRGLVNDVYCQIGLVMLIGLASKNAILIVEFAKEKHEQGLSILEAAMTAARIRLRPILMTALAFILGVVPLVIASGAGAESRHSLGTAVFGGMLASTFLSLVLVPVLYALIETIRERGISRADLAQLVRPLTRFVKRFRKPTAEETA